MNIIFALLIFGLIIAIHEFGHFAFAKLFKVGVIEYAIGMGPLLFHKKIGDTVYSLRAIPFGGYCALYGEQSLETSDKGLEENKEEKIKKKKGPNYKVDWTPEQSLSDKHPLKKIMILIAGPLFNLVLGFFATLFLIISIGSYPEAIVTEVAKGSVASSVGIEVDDKLLEINGREILTFSDLETYMLTHKQDLKNGFFIKIERNNEEMLLKVEPDENFEKLGVSFPIAMEKKNFIDTIKYSINDTKGYIYLVFDSLGMLFDGSAKVNDLSGAVGITDAIGDTITVATKESALATLHTILAIIAFLSINIGMMNLLPFPALDGGRIVLATIELLIRKKIPQKIEGAINAVGMLCLISLMIFTLFNDVFKLIQS